MGFVQIPDDLTGWEWFDDKNTVYVLLWLTLRAAWSDTRYRGEELKRGQVITTYPEIAEKCGLSIQQARTIIERLKSTGKATVRKTAKFSIITLLEYDNGNKINSQSSSQITVKQQSNNSPSLYNTNDQTIKPPNAALAREGGFFENADSSVKTNEGFERFWAAYPKKTAKQQAFKAWQRLKPDEGLLSVILTSLERHKKSVQWTKDGGRFIPYPATWLNGRRWEDELQEVNKNGKSCTDIERRSKVEWLRGFE